ncbi:MAG: DUF58 domain-containing protein [Myxococcota bacterium]
MPRPLVLLRRARDAFPPTPLGLLALAAAWLALDLLAFERLDLVALVVGYGLLGLVGLAVIGTALFALLLRPRLRRAARAARETLRLETGVAAETALVLPAFRWLPLVQLRWDWSSPVATVDAVPRLGVQRERVVLPRRGEHDTIVRRFLVEDALGLARVTLRLSAASPLRVAPHVGALGALPVLRAFTGGDAVSHPLGDPEGDRLELRRYAPGDPARFIHWKIFGRTRKLVVRLPERALSPARRQVAYLVAGSGDEASAAAARVAVRGGALGDDWAFGAAGTPGLLTEPEAALLAIVRSGSEEAREEAGAGLRAFLAEADRRGPPNALVFVPPEPGPWLEAVCAELATRRGRARAVVAIDGQRRTLRRGGRLRRLLTTPAAASGADPERLADVRRALAAAGTPVTLVDRSTGRVLGERALRPAPREAA